MIDNNKTRILEIKNAIMQWFIQNRQNYSFRNNRNPYRVWVSETILQQTRINAALEKMEFFFSNFPDLHSLANARQEEVVAAFKGLGYYNRARNLHKGAKFILERYKDLPPEYDLLLEIPSIGPYTAAAIASISFGKRTPVIDGNIKRIFARIFEISDEIKSRTFMDTLKLLLFLFFEDGKDHPGDLNEAFMEFGQKICKAKIPECDVCMISARCYSHINSNTANFPVIASRKEKTNVKWRVYFLLNQGNVLLNTYDNFFFLKNHTGFPSVLEINGKILFSAKGILQNDILSNFISHDFQKGPRHSITNYNISFEYCIMDINLDNFEQENLFFCPRGKIDQHLVSSGLDKVWTNALSQIIARGGT